MVYNSLFKYAAVINGLLPAPSTYLDRIGNDLKTIVAIHLKAAIPEYLGRSLLPGLSQYKKARGIKQMKQIFDYPAIQGSGMDKARVFWILSYL